MSGPLVQLVSKGVQDSKFISDNLDSSFFKSKHTKHTNFSQSPKRLDITGRVAPGSRSQIKISKQGDLLTYVWLEGADIIDYLPGTIFELYIGGQLIDTITYEYIADIWNVYLAETSVKASLINNKVSTTDKNFFPLHFFFCGHGNFLPLVNLQYHEVEIKVKWGPNMSGMTPKFYANYVYLDTKERLSFVKKDMEMLITQVQYEAHHVQNGDAKVDISTLNHPVKALFWGHDTKNQDDATDYFTFDNMSILINGQPLVDQMSPNYFHTTQGYYHTTHGNINFTNSSKTPFYTRYFMYSFSQNTTKYFCL